jgi:hypothetical protein
MRLRRFSLAPDGCTHPGEKRAGGLDLPENHRDPEDDVSTGGTSTVALPAGVSTRLWGAAKPGASNYRHRSVLSVL